MPESKKKVTRTPSGKPPANEFFRGDEKGFNGGGMSVASPVGSIFMMHATRESNAMEREISKQAPKGKRVVK